MPKFHERTKIDENLTTNVLIFIYFIFFVFHDLLQTACCICYSRGITKNTACSLLLRELRKAWHICNEFSFLFSLFILSAYGVIVFLYPTLSFIFSLCFLHDKGKKDSEKINVAWGSVPRLDTFGVRIRYAQYTLPCVYI